MPHPPNAVRTALTLAAASILALLLLPASGPVATATDLETANVPPRVMIVTLGGTYYVPYRTTVEWVAWDEDGTIDHSEYAVDPPSVFTAAEVETPETEPGVTITVVPGPEPGRDTLRVTKEVDGDLYSYDWIRTPDMEQDFLFSAPYPDSVFDGSRMVPTGDTIGYHSFYLRAFDDAGAVSRVTSETFTVRNLGPEAEIVDPAPCCIYLGVGRHLTLRWDGSDPDTSAGNPKPAYYLYKLIDLTAQSPPISIIQAVPEHLYSLPGEWVPQSADTTERTFQLSVGHSYIFGVRAVDADGAIEVELDGGRNVVKFITYDIEAPELRLRETRLADFVFPGSQSSYPLTVVRGMPLYFEAECRAITGETCADMRWGLDIADPDGEAGWSDWGAIGALPAFTFNDLSPHTLDVQIRDSYGLVTAGRVEFSLVEFPFDRDVLWVDDVRDQTYPRDNQRDAFWSSLFVDSGRFDGDWTTGSQVFRHEAYGLNDVATVDPVAPPLSELGRYRLIIWECMGYGYDGTSALYKAATGSGDLRLYLAAGGQLWINGTLTVPPVWPLPGESANFTYPLEMKPGSFGWDMLKLFSGEIGNARGIYPDDNLVGVNPFPGQPEFYPALEQDPLKVNPFKGAISDADAVFDPIPARAVPGFTGVIDSLYAYQAVATNRPYHNKLTGLRWHDTAWPPRQGAIQWFGFPLYYMKKAQAQETFNRSIDWFRSVYQPIAVELSHLSAVRSDEGAVIRWGVEQATDHAGFHVYRQEGDGERICLTDVMLSGRTEYEYVDPSPPAGETYYWLAEHGRAGVVTWLGPVALKADRAARPLTALSPLFPNPMTASAGIRFTLAEPGRATVEVFDVQGRRVAVVLDGVLEAGPHETVWNGRSDRGGRAAMGLYIVRLRTAGETRIQKAVVAR